MGFEIGQRVTFRSLQWEVEDSNDAVVTLFGRDTENRGARARVVVGLEPIARTGIPPLRWTVGDAKWNPLEWRALHHAFRLTLSHGRSNLASVDWGRLILEPYQLVPLQRIERLPYPRLLIADDTGLGKTAEAGLILFRLLQRRRADRILVISRARPEPERWRDEMKSKFGIDLTVINDGDDYAKLRREAPSHLNVFGYYPRIVMSMHYAAPSKRSSHVIDDLARVRWDVVIVDEAHHLGDHGERGKRLAELGRVVAETSEALLLLTATPHDGKAESFASLLRLIDPYLVVDPDRLDPALVRPLRVRRLKANVMRSDGTHFLRRKIVPITVEPTKAEAWLEKGLRGYCKQLRKLAKELEAKGERSRAQGATFLDSFLRRRLASSSFACHESIRRRIERLEGKAPSEPAPEDDERGEDRDERPVQVEPLTLPSGKTELEVLQELLKRAERIPEGDEAKVRSALLGLLEKILADPKEKVVIFTEFADTIDMLARVLNTEGFVEQLVTDERQDEPAGKGLFFRYEGATVRKHREAIRRRFLEDPTVRILLATDAASESINLHKGCNNLIHMEAVWNPNRYEQRNGRIDRYGQKHQPRIYILINTKSIDEEVARRGYEKLEEIAQALGSVSNVLPLAARMDIDELLDELGDENAEKVASELERRLDAAAGAAREEAKRSGTGDLLSGESFDEDELRSVESALSTSRGFVPEFKDVEEFLRVYLRAEGGKIDPIRDEPHVFSVHVPTSLRPEVEGRDRIPRATFLRDLAVREEDSEEENRVEFLSPGHPLVRGALRRARGWVFRGDFASRASYRRVAASSPPGVVFTYAARFVDGRGETIEERFESVFVPLDGKASQDSHADIARFIDQGVRGNLTPAEEAALKRRFAPAFDGLVAAAEAESRRRSESRLHELENSQREIVEEALMRLGIWKQASEERLRQKAGPETRALGKAVQLDIMGEVAQQVARELRDRERRLKAFREAQGKLASDETRRREEIRAMQKVRLDALEPIGALALVPEGLS